jgi:putative Mg2+ transporter-C (MgtC) family protein
MVDFDAIYPDLCKIGLSVLCGSIIGFEREYKSKSAGLRTMVLICLGATIFTIISLHGATSDDRIAANIITGIGFIGAGVIFKDGLSVRGLTTASVIWVVASLGMLIGKGEFALSVVLTGIILGILTLFSFLEKSLDLVYASKIFNITFNDGDLKGLTDLENLIKGHKLHYRRLKIAKYGGRINIEFEISGRKKRLGKFNEQIVVLHSIQDIILT